MTWKVIKAQNANVSPPQTPVRVAPNFHFFEKLKVMLTPRSRTDIHCTSQTPVKVAISPQGNAHFWSCALCIWQTDEKDGWKWGNPPVNPTCCNQSPCRDQWWDDPRPKLGCQTILFTYLFASRPSRPLRRGWNILRWKYRRSQVLRVTEAPELPGHLPAPALLEELGAAFPAMFGRMATNSGRKQRCDLESMEQTLVEQVFFSWGRGGGSGFSQNESNYSARPWNLQKCA